MKIKNLNLIYILLFLSVLSGCNSNSKTTLIQLSDEILKASFAEGSHEISIMEISLKSNDLEKLNIITEKMKQSISLKMKWYQEYIERYTGKELPWHEKFGITLDEYDFIINSQKLMALLEKKKSKIEIKKLDSENFIILENPDLPFLSNLTLKMNENLLTNYLGNYEYSSNIKASDEQKITGRWNGSTWTLMFSELQDLENMNAEETYGSISISIGQLENSKKIMIYYKERVIHNNERYNGEEIIIID